LTLLEHYGNNSVKQDSDKCEIYVMVGRSSVVNSGLTRRGRPKTAKRDAVLQRGAFGESGWSGRDCGYKAGAMRVNAGAFHLKPF